jgi:hypothetical protein
MLVKLENGWITNMNFLFFEIDKTNMDSKDMYK